MTHDYQRFGQKDDFLPRSSTHAGPPRRDAWVSQAAFLEAVALSAAAQNEILRAMSQENVEVVIGQLENTNVRDFKAVMDAYADDVILRLHGWLRNIGGVAVVGKEAVGEWFGDWFRMFDGDYRFEVDEPATWGIAC